MTGYKNVDKLPQEEQMEEQEMKQSGTTEPRVSEQKPYATGIAFTSFNYKGYQVNVTARDGDRLQAEGSMLAIMDIIDEVIIPHKEESLDDMDLNAVEGIHYDEVDNTNPPATGDFPDIPEYKDWGLVEWPPKASELSPNDTYEVQVDIYERVPDKIVFWKEGGKYPILTHYLNKEYPKEQFDKIFNGWDPEPTDKAPLPGGPVILKVKCSGPDNLTNAGNPYQNLAGMRRP